MSLRTKPSRVSGKNPAYMKGDYPEMRQKKTQQDLINEGKKFKFSVLKKPYMSDLSYQEMEYEATPLAQSPFSPNAIFPRFPGDIGVPLIGDIAKHPCWCGGCTGAGAMGDTSDLWKELKRLIAEGKIKTEADIKAWIASHWEEQLGGYTLAGVPTEYQCNGTGIETFYITICGRRNEFVNLTSGVGDSLFAQSSFEVPFPDESKCTTIDRCVCYTIGVNVNCGVGFENCEEERYIFLSACKRTQATKIKPSSSGCSSLTIVDEGGGAATDTILRNGSLDFKTTGVCCEAIQWTVSGTGGSITQSGVLTAGPTACGSLLVTATCPACGTSATQYVKVTNGGQWVLTESCYHDHSCNAAICWACTKPFTGCCNYQLGWVTTIIGDTKYYEGWVYGCREVREICSCPEKDSAYCSHVATMPSYTPCPGGCIGGSEVYVVNTNGFTSQYIYKWQC